MSLRDRAEEALKNPNVQLFLDLLAEAEGASKGYNTLFGGSVLQDLSDHPKIMQDYLNSKTGEVSKTSAAGRYQFKKDSWEEQEKRLGLTDFTPHSQDLAAVGLMMYKPSTLEALKKGDFNKALKDYGSYWASLPSSPYDQPHRSEAWVQDKLNELQGSSLRDQHLAMAEEFSTPVQWDGVPHPVPDNVEQTPSLGLGDFVDMHVNNMNSEITPLMAAGIDADAERARNEAVAQFTGNPMRQDIPMPEALDQAIRKLLVDL